MVSGGHIREPSWSPFALQEPELGRASKWGLVSDGDLNLLRVIAIAVAVTWLPLVVLTIIEGTAFGNSVTIPFFRDHIPYGRYLVALPLLLWMDLVVERRTTLAVRNLRSSGLIAEGDEERFQLVVAMVARAWRSKAVRWGLVALTYVTAAVSFVVARDIDVSNWIFTGERGAAGLSFAGAWNLLVSAALVRLLFLRALWKLTVWVWLLGRLARLRLQINPMHPDGRCGLRFFGETQLAFSALIAALGVQLGCLIAVAVRFQGLQLASFKLVAAAFVLLSLIILLGPLVVFARQAWLAKERAENEFSAWAALAARHMSAQLVESRRGHLPGQLSTAEISSMTDASALFDRMLATWPIPIDTRQVTIVVLVASVSTLLPLLALLPLADIMQRLLKILL
jgi:hypothetical protein